MKTTEPVTQLIFQRTNQHLLGLAGHFAIYTDVVQTAHRTETKVLKGGVADIRQVALPDSSLKILGNLN